MSCKKFRILLSGYLDQEITEAEEKKLLEHLKTCSGCSHELEYLKKVKKVFLLKEKKKPLDFFETRLLARIRDMRTPSIWEVYLPLFKRSIPVVVVVFFLVLGIINRDKLFYNRANEIISDLLVDEQVEEDFEEELLEIYYGN